MKIIFRVIYYLIKFTISIVAAKAFADENTCIPIDRSYYINAPGKYCVTKDLHSRIAGPPGSHHYSEDAMIEINSSNVDLDLKGHTVGRGVIFRDAGKGSGINIIESYSVEKDRILRFQNITIKNGTLRDFYIGIRRTVAPASEYDDQGKKTYDEISVVINPVIYKNNIFFSQDNIRIENINFEKNIKNVEIAEIKKIPIAERIASAKESTLKKLHSYTFTALQSEGIKKNNFSSNNYIFKNDLDVIENIKILSFDDDPDRYKRNKNFVDFSCNKIQKDDFISAILRIPRGMGG